MLYRLRTGDILLCEEKQQKHTCMYLIAWDSLDGYCLYCLSCGDKVGSYKRNKDLLKHDIQNIFNVVGVIPKETMIAMTNNNYNMKYPIKVHDIICEYNELGLEIEL